MMTITSHDPDEPETAAAAQPEADSHPTAAPAVEPVAAPFPTFTILAGSAVFLSLFAPRILLLFPVMAAVSCGVLAYTKKERGGIGGLIAAPLAIGVLLLSSWDLAAPTHGNLKAAELVNWTWVPDSSFGTNGTIKWNAEVKNVSDRPISQAKVEFATYDAAGKLLTSTFTYVEAIPPGETRTSDSYADLYGNEASADAKVVAVHFSR